MEISNAVTKLAALAQETRLSIFRLLVEAGPAGLPAGDLSNELGIPPPTLSFHLKDLSHAGLINSIRDGRSIYYSANFTAVNDLLDYLKQNCCRRSKGGRC
jgi:DNA-binding transcriptional ArsR family regulator